jgi:hypothetical protein
MLLQAFYSIRSERQLMERLEFDLLFRWFVGVGVDDVAWDHSTFSKNRERLLEGDIAAKLLSAVMAQPRVKRLLSTDHFSVDGTLVEAWASWAITMVVRPAQGVCSTSWNAYSDSESRAGVASSSRMIGASLRKARAMAIRWRCPPENCIPCSPHGVSIRLGSPL